MNVLITGSSGLIVSRRLRRRPLRRLGRRQRAGNGFCLPARPMSEGETPAG